MKKFCLIAWIVILLLSGCGQTEKAVSVKLDPKNPVTITVWHYYNGIQKAAFDALVKEFNETEGTKKGIFVTGYNQGDVNRLEESVKAAIDKEVGSDEVPNIFASYADTAYEIEKQGYLVDLEKYMTTKELDEYVESYIEEGRIGENNEFKIFPVAKSTEIFLMNRTDWDKFSQATGISMESLKTKEGLVEVAEKYYQWTDSLTPDIPDDGKAFYGRDAMANLLLIGSMQLGHEIFHVDRQKVTLDVDKEVIRKIWNFYYVPYIKGYFYSYGKFRADDVAIGKVIALTGSTASVGYFPEQVEIEDSVYPIETVALPVPAFKEGESYAVQQGAGMVVTKSTPEEEYASVQFLKWITDSKRNTEFFSGAGYLPVKKDANKREVLDAVIQEGIIEVDKNVYDAITIGYDTIKNSILYTNKAFEGANEARGVLNSSLSDQAIADRKQVEQAMEQGISWKDAIAPYIAEENFEQWFTQFKQSLEKIINQADKK